MDKETLYFLSGPIVNLIIHKYYNGLDPITEIVDPLDYAKSVSTATTFFDLQKLPGTQHCMKLRDGRQGCYAYHMKIITNSNSVNNFALKSWFQNYEGRAVMRGTCWETSDSGCAFESKIIYLPHGSELGTTLGFDVFSLKGITVWIIDPITLERKQKIENIKDARKEKPVPSVFPKVNTDSKLGFTQNQFNYGKFGEHHKPCIDKYNIKSDNANDAKAKCYMIEVDITKAKIPEEAEALFKMTGTTLTILKDANFKFINDNQEEPYKTGNKVDIL